MKSQLKLALLFLAVFMLLFALPVLAQAPGSGEASNVLEALVALLLTSAFNVPFALILTNLVKRLPFLMTVPAPTINAVIVAVLLIVTIGSNVLGLEVQWRQLLDTLGEVAPPILALLATLLGSQGIHNVLRSNNLPGGYSRS